MKKRLLSMILAISMVLTFLPVSAVTAFASGDTSSVLTSPDGTNTQYGKLYYTITKEATNDANGEVSVVGWKNGASYNQKVTIPQTVEHEDKTYTVTAIGERAFWNSSDLETVTIPASVISIGNSAFSSSSLVSATIPGTVQTVGNRAFNGCESLKTLEIQNGVVSIGESAFSNCINLTSVTIPATVKAMGQRAFDSCTDLTSINIQNSVIGEYAFSDCTGLTSVTIPDTVTTMGKSAFMSCTGLTSINIQNSVIGEMAFYSCTSLEEVTIPATVTSFGISAFSNCTKLSKVTVQEGVTSIGQNAFYGDVLLSDVSLPSTLKTIDKYAFYGCSVLTNISIPTKTETIGQYAFASTGLSEINIPDSVIDLGSGAFSGCKTLTTAHLPANLSSKTIPSSIFSGCVILNTVNIPDGTTTIGSSAFNGCTALSEINIPQSVKSISDYAFSRTGFTEIKLPEGVETLDSGAFIACPNLTTVTLPCSLKSVGYSSGTFALCPKLTTVIFNSPGSMTDLNRYTFSGCSNLNSVTLPDSLTDIKMEAFKGCSSLEELTLPDKVKSIGESAFENCTSLKQLTIPQDGNYYLSIGSNAFKGCTSLEKIYYKGNLANLKQFKSGITGLTISDDNNATIEYTGQTAIPVLYTCTVTLDPGNGTLTDNQIKVYHTEKVLETKANELKAMPEPTPASSDNVFAGWYTDAAPQDDTTKFDVETPVTADMKLYAVYTLKTKGVTVSPGVTVKDADGNTINPDGSGKVSVTPGQEITLSPTTKNDGDAYEWTISGNGSEPPETKIRDSITVTVNDETNIKLSTLKALHITTDGEPDITGTKYDADKNTYYGNGWEYSKNDGLTIKETKDLSNEPAVTVNVTVETGKTLSNAKLEGSVTNNGTISNARLTGDVTNNGTLSNCVLDNAPNGNGSVENSLFGAEYTGAKTLTEADGKAITAALTGVKDGTLTGETLWFVGSPELTATVENNTAIKHINHKAVTESTIDGLNSFTVTGDSVTFTPNGEKDILLNNRTAESGDFTFTTPKGCTYDGNVHKVEDITSTTYTDGEYTVKYDYVKKDGSTGTTEEPKDAGTYTVKIVMSDGQTITTNESFTISPAKPGKDDFDAKLPYGVTEDRDDSEKTAEVQLKSDSLFQKNGANVEQEYQKKNANGDWEKVTAPSGKGEYKLVATVTPKDTTNLSEGTVEWEFTILDREDAGWLTMSVEDGKITKVTRPAADDAEAEEDITEKVLLTASADGSKTAYKVPAGAQVTVTANDAPQDMKFEMWRFSINSMNGDTTLALYSRSMTFTLKDDFAGLTVSAMYQDAAIDSGYDILGPAAAATTAVVGSAILAYQGHMLGTELYLIYLLPSGAVIPANRIQLAMLLWQDAGNPAPVDETPYSDIDSGDTDAMQAAQWAVETGLMELPDADNAPDQFDPYAAVSNVDVIHAWKKAQKVKG